MCEYMDQSASTSDSQHGCSGILLVAIPAGYLISMQIKGRGLTLVECLAELITQQLLSFALSLKTEE